MFLRMQTKRNANDIDVVYPPIVCLQTIFSHESSFECSEAAQFCIPYFTCLPRTPFVVAMETVLVIFFQKAIRVGIYFFYCYFI